MTITLAQNAARVSYSVSAGATQTSFTVSFEFFDDADLNVYVDGTLKTISTHYTVSGGSGSTGAVAISVTGASGGSTVVITRSIALARTTDFPSSGSFQIGTLNTELDRFTAIAADLKDSVDRGLILSDSDSSVSTTLPLLANRKGTVLGFNASTGAVEAGPSITAVQSLADVTASINLLGTSDAVSDMNTLATTSNVNNISSVAGITSNVSTVAGIASNVTAVAGDATDIGAVAAKATEIGRLGTSAAVADMVILGTSDVVADMNTLGTAAIVEDMNLLGTSANVTAMGLLGNSTVIADMAILGTSDIVADMAILGTSDVVADMNTLGTSDIVSDMNTLATSANVTAMGLLGTQTVVNDISTLANDQNNPQITNLTVSGNLEANGAVTFGNAATDTVAFNGVITTDLIPTPASSPDLGSTSKKWTDLYIDGTAYLDAMTTLSCDINGGAIDGTTIGSAAASTGAFTTLSATGNITAGGTVDGVDLQTLNTAVTANTAKTTNATHTGEVTGSGALTIANNAVTTAKINADAVTNAKLADNSVDSEQYVDGSIDTAHIADANVTQAKIAGEAINESKMQVSNAPVNGYMLTAQSGNTGGLTWAEAGGGGGGAMEFIASSGAIDDDASVVFTSSHFDSSSYRSYVFYSYNIIPVNDGSDFYAVISTDNGSSYQGGSEYKSSNSNRGQFRLAGFGLGNATDEYGGSGPFYLYNPHDTNVWSFAYSQLMGQSFNSGVFKQMLDNNKAMAWAGTASINNIKFTISSGNIKTGRVDMYGLKLS